jgi:hypothetical protein
MDFSLFSRASPETICAGLDHGRGLIGRAFDVGRMSSATSTHDTDGGGLIIAPQGLNFVVVGQPWSTSYDPNSVQP